MATSRRMDASEKPRIQATSDLFDRQPPCNIEAEYGVLCSILLRPDVCDDIADILRPDDFFDDSNRRLFEAMRNMHDAGRKIDPMLLVEELKQAGIFEQIGGIDYLARVSEAEGTAAHAVYYAQIVRNKATFRALINVSTDILHDAYQESADSREMLSKAEQRIFSILDNRGSASISEIKDVLMAAMDRIDARMKGEHDTGGVKTGFSVLDEMTGGFHGSELLILAARPSMGKTAFAMNIAEHVATKVKAPTLFVSLEMGAIELADRLLCSAAGVNGHRLRNGSISTADVARLVEVSGRISQAPLFVDDSPSRTMTEIAAAARRIHRREGSLGLIVIDYLQLIEPDSSSDPRQEQVARIARRLKGLAREMNVPVLCLAQLNRQTEASKDNIPRLSHLRESGAIEQDADVVMFVHREEYYLSGEEQAQAAGKAQIIIAKQRNGPVGEIDLLWQKDFTRFVDPAPEYHADLAEFSGPA